MKFKFGFHKHISQIVFNYLTNRSLSVKLENVISDNRMINAGLYTCRSALLASCFLLGKFCTRITSSLITGRAIFTSQLKLNEYLNSIHEYTSLWKISLNPNKCEAVAFRGRYDILGRKSREAIKRVKIKINGSEIRINNLGVSFNSNLKSPEHLKLNHIRTVKTISRF